MASTFGGFEVARRAMNAGRMGVEIAQHNIANADTEGYTRQRIELTATKAETVPLASGKKGQVGTGVDVTGIVRLRSSFSDLLVRRNTSSLGNTEAQLEASSRVDQLFLEPGDNGLGAALDQFWSSWQELSKRPSDEGLRRKVIESGQEVLDGFKTLESGIADVSSEIMTDLTSDINKVNDLTGRIGNLNEQIRRAVANGESPLDMLDERDKYIDSLSSLVDVKTQDNPDGTVSIYSGGRWVVDGTGTIELQKPSTGPNGKVVILGEDGSAFSFSSGRLSGHVEAAKTVGDYRSKLNAIRDGFIDTVNSAYNDDYGDADHDVSYDFFISGSDGSELSSRLADASGNIYPGNLSVDELDSDGTTVHSGARALKIAKLKDTGTPNTISEYAGFVELVGSDTSRLSGLQESQSLALEQEQNMRDQLSGVSVDEELLNVTKYEASYNAAAKIVSVLDEMLKTVLSLGD